MDYNIEKIEDIKFEDIELNEDLKKKSKSQRLSCQAVVITVMEIHLSKFSSNYL